MDRPHRAGRRALLAGAVSLLAGCPGDEGTPSETTVDWETPTETTVPRTELPPTPKAVTGALGERLTVGGVDVSTDGDLAATRSLLVDEEPIVVTAADGRQFAFFGVAVEEGSPPRLRAFSLDADDQRFDPFQTVAGQIPFWVGLSRDYPYGDVVGTAEGWLGFDLPAPLSEASSLALILETDGEVGRWRVPDELTGSLRSPPAKFSYEGTSVPESVVPGMSFDVGVTLRNTGGGRGDAIVAVREYLDDNYVGQTATTVTVDPDSTVTVRVNVAAILDADGDQVRLEVRTSGGSQTLTVDVQR